MLKTTELSEILALIVFEVNNNKVVGNSDSRANKIVENLAKFKNIKNLSKVKKILQRPDIRKNLPS